MANELEIRSATAHDFDAAVGLLSSANLPVEDLNADDIGGFVVASIGDTVVGLIGLEQCQHTALLRSLVVDPGFRRAGLGRVLVAALESQASRQGIQDLWLLTIDAEAWFSGLGYTTQPRDQVPDAIRRTAEFSRLCPGDAVLMKKVL